ncbi:MAG: hypothetical protein H0X39_17960 [Actinobacteria bacterium]|nr:hypothetical protein [Actinomycetota bacterium]
MRAGLVAELMTLAECACGAAYTARDWLQLVEVSLETEDGGWTELRLCHFCYATLTTHVASSEKKAPETVRVPESLLGDLRQATRLSVLPTLPVPLFGAGTREGLT